MALSSTVWFKLFHWVSMCKAAADTPYNTLAPTTTWICSLRVNSGVVSWRGQPQAVRENSFSLFTSNNSLSPSCRRSQCWSAGRHIGLIFDVLDDRQLRHSLLDPQSGESGSGVGVPALSHQLAHHTQSLEHQRGDSISYIKAKMPLYLDDRLKCLLLTLNNKNTKSLHSKSSQRTVQITIVGKVFGITLYLVDKIMWYVRITETVLVPLFLC